MPKVFEVRPLPKVTSGLPDLVGALDPTLTDLRLAMQGKMPVTSLVVRGPRPWADARAYGATGDGVASDSAAFTDAIAAAAIAGGGTVYVPGGTYLFSTAVTLLAGCELVGEGVNRTVITVAAGATINGIVPQSNTRIAHLTLRGPNSVQTPSQGINSGSAVNVVIENCVIEKWGAHGINTGGSSTDWHIFNNLIQDNKNDGILIAFDSHRALIADNTVQNNGSNGIDLNASYCVVEGNIVRGNGNRLTGGTDEWGILLAAINANPSDADFNVVRGNVVLATKSIGIILKADNVSRHCNYNVITGNLVDGTVASPETNQDGITLDGSSAGTLEGNSLTSNICRSCNRHGILVDGAVATVSRTLVANNTTVSNSNTGIRAAAIDVWIIGNVTLGNTIAQLDDSGSTRSSKTANKTTTSNAYIGLDNIAVGGGTPILGHLSSTVVWDPPNVAAGSQTTTTVTVTGAALGNTVTVGFSLDLQGMQLTGYASSANTVTVVLRNGTAGDLDLGSGTLRADAWQH